jgi:hypothetical protein
MKNTIFSILFLLCVSFSANATLIFTMTGQTTSASGNNHTFDMNSVTLTSTEGYTLDGMDNSILGLLSTGSLAFFNGYTSYLWQTDIGTTNVVDTAESHSLSLEKEASIFDLDTNVLILEGLLTVESEWIYASNFGSFTMEFNTNSGSGGGTNPVPAPPALWLMASGLIGLVGVSRRKKKV